MGSAIFTITQLNTNTMGMQHLLFLSLCIVGAFSAINPKFSCQECVDEMNDLAYLIQAGAPAIEAYLAANYCPTIEDPENRCEEDLSHGYSLMLSAIVNHYFVDGALHICQIGGRCDAQREYTCDDCKEGLRWVEMYMEDPIQVSEYTLYLIQHVCTDERCQNVVAEHFPPMHYMAMEKFMIPDEICNQEDVCNDDSEATTPGDEDNFSCEECVREMRDLGYLIQAGAPFIEAYLAENYCPTIEDPEDRCEEDLSQGYSRMLGAIVNHYFIDGALHICQTGGLCDVRSREYTCQDCKEGLRWVEAYPEDPIQVSEYTLYLIQNVCTDERCRNVVAEHFPPMHYMAMEKFMIPDEICNMEEVCTGGLL